jgi:2-polyprenyl-3-methyl-5-hydroxy-6-metoxy-1,4-benzoquinol methylase
MQTELRSCEVCRGSDFASLFEKADHCFVRCARCGLERIDPPPTDETLAAIYGKHYYDAWGLHGDEQTVAELKKGTFAYVLDALPESVRGGRLLDCGAATGFLLDVAKERGFKPYGIELSEFGANEIARKFGEDRAFRGEIEDAKFPDAGEGSFQAITMCDYIEHVRSPRRVLEKARKLLAHKGVVAMTTPDAGSMTRKVLASGWSHYKVEHLHYFKKENLKRLLEDVGFSRVTFRLLWKSLNLKYMREQFEVYPHPVLTPVARGLGKTLPDSLQRRPLRVLTGELLALAYS